MPTKTENYYWIARRVKPLKGFTIDAPSIHAVINSKTQKYIKNSHHASNTMSLLRMKSKRMPIIEALHDMGGNCPADPRRTARIKKWLLKIEK